MYWEPEAAEGLEGQGAKSGGRDRIWDHGEVGILQIPVPTTKFAALRCSICYVWESIP